MGEQVMRHAIYISSDGIIIIIILVMQLIL